MVSAVHNQNTRTGRAGGGSVKERARRLLRVLGWSRKDAVAVLLAGCAAIAILVNVLFMQSGSHPSPMFHAGAAGVKSMVTSGRAPIAASSARRAEPAPVAGRVIASAATRTAAEIVSDIQRELARRGYYDGAVDGVYGPKTDGAVRDFEQAGGLKPSIEPNEALLQAITRAPARLTKAPSAAAPPAVRMALVRSDPAADRLAPSKRIIALQRALAEYGYGQIKPSGMVDAGTHAAIARFERERNLPITGQASDRVVRELAALTGRPLE
jgi:peptidoglycan hydrolase-like protein with peptidoglycan-binding domain